MIKIKGKNTEYVVKAFNSLERKYGKIVYKKERTQIYYAHPYCLGKRGSNDNNNRMTRRWIPKGTLIDNISKEFIKQIEDWINNYPRAMFEYKSSNELLLNI